MDDDYNVIDTFDDGPLVYDGAEGSGALDDTDSALVALNNEGSRRTTKRRHVEMFDQVPNDDRFVHPIDWHMRVPLTLEEREAKRQKQLLEEEILDRLTARIIDVRRKSRGENSEQKDGMESTTLPSENKVMCAPPVDGTPWLGVSSDGKEERYYIRLHPSALKRRIRDYLEESRQTIIGRDFSVIVKEAELFRREVEERKMEEGLKENDSQLSSLQTDTDGLWVNKYAPKTFADLLSDDAINRNLMTWLKLWDECVFKRKGARLDTMVPEKERDLYAMDEGKLKRPHYKIVVLSGAAGLGKTTLVDVAARQAGYALVQTNASDNRNVADFERVIDGALRNKRTIDMDNAKGRPNCLLLDEIDGAPIETIRYLVRTVTATGKKALKRPIICVCNNLYTPALRELRSIALTLQMNQTRQERLVDRLEQISAVEKLRVDRGSLSCLSELCRCDVRFAINTLQLVIHYVLIWRFVAIESRSENRIIAKTDIQKAVEREQSGAASVFDAWNTVLDLTRHLDNKGHQLSAWERWRRIERVISEQGDDRFIQGLHANYCRLPLSIGMIRAAANHFLYYDRVLLTVQEKQTYVLMKYVIAFYIGLHQSVATYQRAIVKYPTEEMKVQQRKRESEETLASIRSQGHSRSNVIELVRDLLPMLVIITQPPMKPMNEQLYNSRDEAVIVGVVQRMVQFGLTFSAVVVDHQVHYMYNPSVDVLTMFPIRDTRHRQPLVSATRQMLSKRIAQYRARQSVESSLVPGANQENSNWMKDRFEGLSHKNIESKRLPLFYKFNAGFSDAVKKNIRMKDLLF